MKGAVSMSMSSRIKGLVALLVGGVIWCGSGYAEARPGSPNPGKVRIRITRKSNVSRQMARNLVRTTLRARPNQFYTSPEARGQRDRLERCTGGCSIVQWARRTGYTLHAITVSNNTLAMNPAAEAKIEYTHPTLPKMTFRARNLYPRDSRGDPSKIVIEDHFLAEPDRY